MSEQDELERYNEDRQLHDEDAARREHEALPIDFPSLVVYLRDWIDKHVSENPDDEHTRGYLHALTDVLHVMEAKTERG